MRQRKFPRRFHRLFGRLASLAFVLLLLVLFAVSVPVWIFGASIALAFVSGLRVGYSLFGGLVAFAITAATLWFSYFLFTLLRDVWEEFCDHRASATG